LDAWLVIEDRLRERKIRLSSSFVYHPIANAGLVADEARAIFCYQPTGGGKCCRRGSPSPRPLDQAGTSYHDRSNRRRESTHRKASARKGGLQAFALDGHQDRRSSDSLLMRELGATHLRARHQTQERKQGDQIMLKNMLVSASILTLAVIGGASAQDVRELSFGYDQPKGTGYGFAGDLFESMIAELSGGSLKINQFPGAQLGQEPVMLQKMRSGDIDFIITASANGATLSPQLGVMSIHYLFENEDHLAKAISSPELNAAVKQLVEDTVDGAHVLTLLTLGLRNIYAKEPVTSVEALNGKKVRVQATKTEDTLFPAYGAQPVHMPFGEVYTSIQTGVVDMAENGVNVYLSNKHYEVAPVMSFTQHEANNNMLWVSDKTWQSLTEEQKGWVEEAARAVGEQEPPYALQLEKESAEKLKSIGVQIVEEVDKSGFIAKASPIQDQLAAELGPDAVKIVEIIRGLK
jgi:tripartite ATP-independent transporter DctP family solute receptor